MTTETLAPDDLIGADAPGIEAAASMAPDAASPPGAAAPFGALWKAMGSGMTLALPALASLQADYLQQAATLWNAAMLRGPWMAAPTGVNHDDPRFSSPDWTSNPLASFIAQLYLLNSRTLLRLVDAVQTDEKTRRRLRFGVQQWIDATSPSNYLAFNPEAQRRALETSGGSLSHGMLQMWRDLRQGHVSQTDHAMFEVGKNLAVTEGSVVFQNAMFQLIEYKPVTAEVHRTPLLMVPPCINKYYILDLQPANSFVRHAVEQGHRTFLVSWRNPDQSLAKTTWDDYVEQGVIRAIDAVRDIVGRADDAGDAASDAGPKVDLLGFCVGGTILTTALAVLAARGRQPANSLTLLTTFLDFSETGVMDVFIDEDAVRWRERTIGAGSPAGGGLLKGKDLATTFSFLRPNDLVWNYVVGNYLMGNKPPPFDLLYWNADATNLCGPMYAWYLRNTYLENNLVVPGKVTLCGEKVDLGSFDAPAYVYASREDHIVPWEGAYRSTQVLRNPKRFTLGASGHIAGVINPPAKKKRSYWTAPEPAPSATRKASSRKAPYAGTAFPADPQAWLEVAEEHPGSWWTDWAAWLATQSGPMVPAPSAPGSDAYPVVEPAPGRYVLAKA